MDDLFDGKNNGLLNSDRVKIIDSPRQFAGQDPIIQEWHFGGPSSPRDVRLIIDAETLSLMLGIARESKTKRCVLHHAGFIIKLRKSGGGHMYETLHIQSSYPTVEAVPTSISQEIPMRQAQWLLHNNKR